MSEPKPFAALGASLLARKGAARPAMRPQLQPIPGASGNLDSLDEDCGWNDMGEEAPASAHHTSTQLNLTPAPHHPSEGTGNSETDRAEHAKLSGSNDLEPPAKPMVVQQREEFAAKLGSVDDDDDHENYYGVEDEDEDDAESESNEAAPIPLKKQALERPRSDEPSSDEPRSSVLSQKPMALQRPPADEEPASAAPAAAAPEATNDVPRPTVAAMPSATMPVAVEAKSRPASAARPRRSRRSALDRGAKAAFTLRLDADRHLRLRLACTSRNRSAQQLVTEALDSLLSEMPELDALASHLKRD